jgi:polar amino acid transport system substrate-binding protein
MIQRTRAMVAAVTALGTLMVGALSACSNPEQTGTDAKPSAAGKTIEVERDAKIAAMVPAKVRDRGTLTAAISVDVAPIKFVNSDGDIDGLNPQLLRGAAKVLGLKLDLQKGTPDSMLPGLEANRFDILASYGDVKERRAKIDFVDYLTAGTSVLTSAKFAKDKIVPSVDLCGLTVSYVRAAAQQGLTMAASKECEKNGKKPIDGAPFGDGNSGILSVQSGQADAFWGDSAAMAFNASTKPDLFKVVYTKNTAYYGIGVNKANRELTDAIQAALVKLEADGVYAQLTKRWGVEANEAPDFPINAGPSINDL